MGRRLKRMAQICRTSKKERPGSTGVEGFTQTAGTTTIGVSGGVSGGVLPTLTTSPGGFTMDGEAVEFGGLAPDAPGLDLLPLVIGSEGLLVVVTEVTVRLVPRPAVARCLMASFADAAEAGAAVEHDEKLAGSELHTARVPANLDGVGSWARDAASNAPKRDAHGSHGSSPRIWPLR